jgi:hypothetical protein
MECAVFSELIRQGSIRHRINPISPHTKPSPAVELQRVMDRPERGAVRASGAEGQLAVGRLREGENLRPSFPFGIDRCVGQARIRATAARHEVGLSSLTEGMLPSFLPWNFFTPEFVGVLRREGSSRSPR